jgi:(2R)-3-sulfolactate dehydrogenase (NADP+)
MPRLTLDRIETLVFAALTRAGAASHQAQPVAVSIRLAEADAIRPVGLGYLPIYLAHLRSGKVDGGATPVVTKTAPAVIRADAAHGFAHPAFDAAFPALIDSCRACGTASLAVTRSYSAGVLGHPLEALANAGLVAFAVTNSPPNIAPWGGRNKLFGTNPMAFAAPRDGKPPLVIDQATSVVTKVALVAAAKSGRRIPEGWAFDADGHPTSDPERALTGSMAPFGGVKGASIALMVDLLAAGMTGANFSKDVGPYAEPEGKPPGVGQFITVWDSRAFDPGFATRIETLFAAMLAQAGVRLPGDRRLEARARAARDGIDVDDATIAACDLRL